MKLNIQMFRKHATCVHLLTCISCILTPLRELTALPRPTSWFRGGAPGETEGGTGGGKEGGEGVEGKGGEGV